MDHKPYQVPTNGKFSLSSIPPDETEKFASKEDAEKKLALDIEELSEKQGTLYAQGSQAVLVIFQGMDTAGKDGAIKHVLTGLNPQGVEVHNFREPSAEELDHDYLWRCSKVLPGRGRVGIFNRSYYEEVLTVRVHPELLKAQRLPKMEMPEDIWKQRFEQIRNYESYLVENGISVLKFFLHISKEEQKKRLLDRIEHRDKNYKITPADISERGYWAQYMDAYQSLLAKTSTKEAPWYVVPSDHKWFTRVVVADVLVKHLESLDLDNSDAKQTKDREAELAAAKKALLAET
jgi:PPK2 family polyphosphate:nucleotide phosphotransferase